MVDAFIVYESRVKGILFFTSAMRNRLYTLRRYVLCIVRQLKIECQSGFIPRGVRVKGM